MTAEEYLEQISKLEHQIRCMKYRVKEYSQLALSINGVNYDKDMVDGTKANRAPFEKWIQMKCDLEKEVAKKEKELNLIKSNVLLIIEKINNEDLKNLIYWRYFKNMSWLDIASSLYVSKASVYRLREEALALVEQSLNSK